MIKETGRFSIAFAIAACTFPSAVQAAMKISAAPTQNVTCSAGVCSATAKAAVLNVADLASMLAGGDVTVASGHMAKDIQFKARLSWVGTSRLTLDSYRATSFYEPVIVAGTGALTITTNSGETGGDFAFIQKGRIEFWDTDSSLIINGTTYRLARSIKQIAEMVNRGPGSNIALARDFRAPAQPYFKSPINNIFQGNFEGLGNTISGLSINSSGSAGLFSYYDTEGFAHNAIRDIGLTGVSITGGADNQSIGALVATMLFGTVKNAFATGSISSSGSHSIVGGLVGNHQLAAIENSHAGVDISATGDGSIAGGLVGETVAQCACNIISGSYATGTVTAGDGAMAGGLVGENIGTEFVNTYAMGSVSGGSAASVGGFAGVNSNTTPPQSTATILTSYSTGPVSGGPDATVGGFIGSDSAGTVTTHAYWDMETSGIGDPSRGAGNIANDPGITGLTTSQLTSGLPIGFDRTFWRQNAAVNGGYPYLINRPPK